MGTSPTNTLVSILTPSYNQAAWLPDNLKSVANQTYPEIEHIIMDGGSDDGSVDLLKEATPPVTWRSEPDHGQSDALNKAFDASRGEFIGWINSDDAYVDRRAVAAAVDVFQRYPDVGVVYGHALGVNSANRMLQVHWAPPHPRWWLNLRPFCQPAVFFRRSIIEPPLVNEKLHFTMDWDLWLRLSRKTTFKRINLIVGLDRYQPQRKTLMGDPHYQELLAYGRERGHPHNAHGRRLARILMGIGTRLVGIPAAISAPRSIDPAIDLDFGTVPSRLNIQILTRTQRMPFS